MPVEPCELRIGDVAGEDHLCAEAEPLDLAPEALHQPTGATREHQRDALAAPREIARVGLDDAALVLARLDRADAEPIATGVDAGEARRSCAFDGIVGKARAG